MTNTNKQAKRRHFSGKPKSKKLKEKVLSSKSKLSIISIGTKLCSQTQDDFLFLKKRKILVQPNTKQEANKNHRLMKRKTKELKTNQGWN